MTTITLKINERTKAGKAFMAILDFFKDSKTIEVVDSGETAKEDAFMKDIETALREVKEIQDGKLKAKPLNELLNE